MLAPKSISIHDAAQWLADAVQDRPVPRLADISLKEDSAFTADDDRYFFQVMPHYNAIVAAIKKGEIRALDEFSMIPVPFSKDMEGTQPIHYGDYLQFAKGMGFSVVETEVLSPDSDDPPATVATHAGPNTTVHKLRTNSLDAPIQKAIKQAGSTDTAPVFVRLKELALSGELPFTGLVEGGALCYTDDNDRPATLTKKQLVKRLTKYR